MLSTLAQGVWSYGRRHDLLRRRDRILLAVSGGADSMAMLEIMRELAGSYGLHLHVAHIDHGLRGTEGSRDRTFVRRYAALTGLPVSVSHADVYGRRKAEKLSPEAAARAERYEALERIRRRYGLRVIVTAHHADDQIETVLMRVMRGSSIKGLAGIRPALGYPPLVRPFLPVRRSELMLYVADRRIPYREDSTNTDIRYTRNRVRHQTIPGLLRHGQQALLAGLPALADRARRLHDNLQTVLQNVLAEDIIMEHGRTLVRVDALRSLPDTIRHSAIGMLLSDIGTDLTSDRIERVDRLIDQAPGKRVRFVASMAEVLRDRAHLVFGPVTAGRPLPASLRPGGTARVGTSSVSAGLPGPLPHDVRAGRTGIWVDAASIRGGMTVRPWRAGDSMLPLGMGGQRKNVSDILRDAHVPLYYKGTVPVVTSGGRIVWVCGIRQDERSKLTAGSVSAVKLTYHPHV